MKLFYLGAFLFMSFFASSQLTGNLLSTWSDSTLVASSAYNNKYNEVWGLAINGREYAIIGTTLGTHFIDVTDPSSPTEAHLVYGKATGAQIVHRDFHDHKGYLYIVADEGASSTLQIVDISTLPAEPIVVYDNQFLINRAHNIFIDAATDRLYALSVRTSSGYAGYAVYDITDPIDPQELHRGSDIAGFTFNHVHDAYVKDNIGFFNCGNDGFVMADMTDLNNIQLIHSLRPSEYPQSGYNHSGWPSEDGSTYFFADENHGRAIKVLDVSSPSGTVLLGTLTSKSADPFSMPHNQIVHGDLLYVSYYYDGLHVYDISDPNSISLVMHYPTSKIAPRDGYEGAWGVYPFLPSGIILVSDMQEGLFVFENFTVSNTDETESNPEEVVLYPNPSIGTFTIQNNYSVPIQNISVYSTTGSKMKNIDIQVLPKEKHVCNLNGPNGTYFLKIMYENNKQLVRSVVIDNK